MKTKSAKFILPLLTLLAALAFAPGCASKTLSRVAITATSTAITTADAAISAWSDYVVAERKRIEALKATDPGAALDASTKLTVNEGKVSSAYYRYQDAARAAVLAGSASADGSGGAAASIAAAAGPLIALVASLTTH